MPQLMRTSNPALNDQAFQGQGVAVGDAMTLQGTGEQNRYSPDLYSSNRSLDLEFIPSLAVS